MIDQSCVKIQNGSVVKIKDFSQEAKFKNDLKQDYKIISVDGCVIKTGLRSDFVVEFPSGRPVIVELKGSNVEHALKQVNATADRGLADAWLAKPVGALIVASRLRPAALTIVQRSSRKYQLTFGGALKVSTSPKEWSHRDFF